MSVQVLSQLRILYNKSTVETIALKYILTASIILLGISITAVGIPAPKTPIPLSSWRVVAVSTEAAQPLHPPILVNDAVLWRKIGDSALTYSRLDGSLERRYDWLRGIPVQWAAYADDDGIILIWRTLDDVLWIALLTSEGEQITAPIEMAQKVVHFRSVLTDEQRLVLVWLSGDRLMIRAADRLGRSIPAVTLETGVDQFALDEGTNHVYIAWHDSSGLFTGEVNLDAATPEIENTLPLSDFALPGDGWLESLNLLATPEQRAVLWGISRASQPTAAEYAGVLLPPEALAEPQPFTLTLPNADLLRWASVQGDNLVIAAHMDNEWQAVTVSFGQGGPQGFQVIPGSGVTGSPIGTDGSTYAWVSLDLQGQPHLYATTLDQRFGSLRFAEQDNQRQNALRQGIAASPKMLAWFVLPGLGVVLLRGRWYALPAVMGLYWLSKWLIPLGLFAAYPGALGETRSVSPYVVSWVALLLISRIAALVAYIGWGETPDSIRHTAYFLTDAFLTFAIFGASVE